MGWRRDPQVNAHSHTTLSAAAFLFIQKVFHDKSRIGIGKRLRLDCRRLGPSKNIRPGKHPWVIRSWVAERWRGYPTATMKSARLSYPAATSTSDSAAIIRSLRFAARLLPDGRRSRLWVYELKRGGFPGDCHATLLVAQKGASGPRIVQKSTLYLQLSLMNSLSARKLRTWAYERKFACR